MTDTTSISQADVREQTEGYRDLIEKYHVQYGDRWATHETVNAIARVERAVKGKEFSYLVHLRHTTNNQFSRKVFTRVTGVKLHRTQRESLRILEAFVGAGITAAYYQQQAAERAKRESSRLKRQVGARQVSAHGYGLLGMDEFIEALVKSGYTSIVEHSRGSAREWFLFNKEGHGYTFRRAIEHQYIEHLLEEASVGAVESMKQEDTHGQ